MVNWKWEACLINSVIIPLTKLEEINIKACHYGCGAFWYIDVCVENGSRLLA